MGNLFTDKYSLLHLAVGIIFRFFNISFIHSIIIHTLFEIIENSNYGIHFIDKYISIWPGGKKESDTLINSLGDLFYFSIGWYLANLM